MEVSLSPEEYFRQHAASLLHSGEDSADDGNNSNSKEAWSDIDDNSATEDDEAVIKRKRILRHGRKRLSEMRERFNASKKRLFEARKQQLDLEMSQLKSGTHPQYREFMEQVDAWWTGRLEKIKQKMDCNRDVAQLKLESSQRSARNTYIASRGELRRAMILRRKKQMWGLADDLRNLERIREAIIGIACPLSNAAGPVEPVKGSAAPAHSSHLLSLPDTHLSKVDEDADVSAICGIPALLNYSESDLVDTEDSGQTLISTAADGMDIRVPGSRPGYASQIGDEAGSAAYGDGYQGAEEGVASNGDITGAATMAAVAAAGYGAASASQDYQKAYADHRTISDASHMAYNASMPHQESMTATANSSAPAGATATSANANMRGAAAPTAIYHSSSTAAANQPADSYGEPYEKHYYANGDYAAASSSAKIADLVHNAAAEPGAAAYAYGSPRKQQQHAHTNGHAEDHRMAGYSDVQGGHGVKREMPVVDYEGSASGKRHRVVQPSATWSEPSHYQHPQPQQYPSYQGAQEWQEAPVAGASSKPRYHPAEADPAMASYAYDRNDYYNKHHLSVNETGAAGSYRPQYSPPQPAEQPLSQSQAQQQQQPYHYSQQQVQDYRRPGVSSSTYYGGAQKYEYAQEPSAYYHQQANPYHGQDSGYYQGSSHYAHAHSGSAVATAGARQTEGYYQSSHHQYGQQQQRQAAGSYAGQVPNDYQHQQQQHQYASNSSYSGLDTGISMPAPSSSSAWGDYYSQQQQQQHYQGSHGYRQQPHAYDSRGRDPNGYYANGSQPPPPQTHAMHPGNATAATATATATTYHRRQVTTTGGGGEPLHYPSSLANALK
ncbi:hypothetical protein FB645_004322 [Coemansia sp. IMI 203386]|nr:hypothetical protein FB645_004322 [Coemansia sp. IMI 203386]